MLAGRSTGCARASIDPARGTLRTPSTAAKAAFTSVRVSWRIGVPSSALPLLWLRVIIDHLAGRRCGEVADRAFHPIALTIFAHRAHLVVVGGLRLQIHHAHPENRLRMGSVEPDVTFRGLAQI